MLENIEIKELKGNVIFKNGVAFSEIIEQPESIKQIDGCALLKSTLAKIDDETKKIKEFETSLADLKSEKEKDEQLANELKANGYCAIDFLVSNPLSSIAGTYTHQQNCKHKGV